MVVIALVAILGLLASSSMQSLIDRNRLAGRIDGFVGDLRFARSEAITRGLPVAVCPSADGATCLSGDQWHQGWIVFADPDNDGAPADAAAVLRRHKAWNSRDTFVAAAGTGMLTFGRDGFLLSLPGASAVLRAEANDGAPGTGRCVSINRTGRQVVQPAGTGDCA